MSATARFVMQRFYRAANGDPARLPWHRSEPSEILTAAVEGNEASATALDVGCGAGVLSVWLAERGLRVTGLDLLPEAIAMAQARASEKGVNVEFIGGDLFEYAPNRTFDLIVDSGCLHSLIGGSVAAYRRRILDLLAPGGDYVLEHWGKRHALDWRPIGPRRRSQASIERIFSPDLKLVRFVTTDFDAPIPFGPKVRGIGYWFHR